MNIEELIKKSDSDEGLTVEQVLEYERLVKPVTHIYGKYGTLAKQYLEEHNTIKFWILSIQGAVPDYLHNIDEQALKMYDTINERLSKSEQFKKTGNFILDLQTLTKKQHLIEQEILNELVYIN